jgi:hypothetical protein
MTADYTKVALRRAERWETAPAQEGRALLDHELNLNSAASVRRDQQLGRDTVGAAGVVEGSTAFQVSAIAGPPFDLRLGAGRMWVDGLAALAPTDFTYSSQDQIASLPAAGRALVYLDVWEEHVQPAEDPVGVIDPALAMVDTASRTRVGYRVRAATTTATTCQGAWAGFDPAALSTGQLTVVRLGPAQPTDPCDPPGHAQGVVPDSLLRIEVLDQGTAANARFAWSYENGAAAVPIAAIAGNTVTLMPSTSIEFGMDLVEISWLARRADRQNAGGLYTITNIASLATGDVLTLNRPVNAPANARGLVVRRWDGESIGASAQTNATRAGNDLGVRFTAGPGTYRPGDWWGVRARRAEGIEPLTAAEPDGTVHRFAPLALIDIDNATLLSDCRPRFRPLTEIESGSPCTVVVRPGDSLQAAVDSLPPGGGEVCLSAGLFELGSSVIVSGRDRVRITGVGSSTVVRSLGNETVLRFVDSDEVEVVDLAAEATSAGAPPGNTALNGAITFEGCRGVTASGLHVTVPDGALRTQTGITVRERGRRPPERVRVTGNRLVIGAWQTGILVTEGRDVTVEDNHVSLGAAPAGVATPEVNAVFANEMANLFAASVVTRATPGASALRLPVGTSVFFLAASPVLPLVEEWIRIGSPRQGAPRDAFRGFVRQTVAVNGQNLTAAGRRAFQRLNRELRAVGQGIVLGGQRTETARVCGNVVRDAVQGIHLGTSSGAGRDSIEEALVEANVVHLSVAATYARERHAVFVGNARSVGVVDTRCTITRPLGRAGLARSLVDAVRLIGFLGEYVVVRGLSVNGFDVGVRAEPMGSTPTQRVWALRDVMAVGPKGTVGAIAPPTFVRDQVVP